MIALAAITAAWTLGMLILGVGDALIYLAPALLILLPLLQGRYPGDAALVRAGRRRCRRRTRLTAVAPPRRRTATNLLPRGGRLVGAALAGRAPPPVVPSQA